VSIGVWSRPVADASGAPVLRDQGPIGRPGTAKLIKAVGRLAVRLAMIDQQTINDLSSPFRTWGPLPILLGMSAAA
jgi:hypothetical protein